MRRRCGHTGCAGTRKSVSQGVIVLWDNMIKSFSRREAVISLSEGEAECYALVSALSEALSAAAMAKDWLQAPRQESKLGSRSGLRRARHVDAAFRWVQDMVTKGAIQFVNIHSAEMLADVLTKWVTATLMKSSGFGNGLCLPRREIWFVQSRNMAWRPPEGPGQTERPRTFCRCWSPVMRTTTPQRYGHREHGRSVRRSEEDWRLDAVKSCWSRNEKSPEQRDNWVSTERRHHRLKDLRDSKSVTVAKLGSRRRQRKRRRKSHIEKLAHTVFLKEETYHGSQKRSRARLFRYWDTLLQKYILAIQMGFYLFSESFWKSETLLFRTTKRGNTKGSARLKTGCVDGGPADTWSPARKHGGKLSFYFCQIQLCIPAMHDTFQFGVIAPASYDEYTALVKSGNVASKHVNGWRVRSQR